MLPVHRAGRMVPMAHEMGSVVDNAVLINQLVGVVSTFKAFEET